MSGVGITYLWVSKEFPPFIRLEGKRGDYEVYTPERTCRDTGECRWFCCSECGFGFGDIYINNEGKYDVENQPYYCPNCGSRVIG